MSITTAFDGQLREGLRAENLAELISFVDAPTPYADSPPIGEPDACLILNYDGEQFVILGHTGRYLHGMLTHGGYGCDELGLIDVPNEPGYYVMHAARATGGIEHDGEHWQEMSGEWQPALVEDFNHFKVPLPPLVHNLLVKNAVLRKRVERLIEAVAIRS